VPSGLAGLRLDQALARLLPDHSRSRLAQWMRRALVRVDGEPALPRRKVHGGETVTVDADPQEVRADDAPEPIALALAHEDADLLVVDKPAGLVVHPGAGNRHGTLLNALLNFDAALAQLPRAGIVHRLDKDTSGLLAVARSPRAVASLTSQLADRSMGRTYRAIVRGDLAQGGEIEAPIGRHRTERTRMAIVARGRPARTRYSVLERFGIATLVECRLDTGRTHQIRVHLASIGHPLAGDPVYAGRRRETHPLLAAFRRQALHAARLELVHPGSGERVHWTSRIPADIDALLAGLRAESKT